MKIHLSTGLALDDDVLRDVTAIVGRRGRGKTNTATVMVEEAHRVRMRFVVIDPVGVWHGLKSSADGKAPGIPAIVMGGEHADVDLVPTSGQVVADFVTGSDVAGVVLDFRLMRKAEMVRFARAFLERLYHKNREDLLVVIDEADKFAPQRAMGEEAFTLGACEDVVKMGRARGLHAVLITQRPATLNKNVLTQAGILVAHGLVAPQDKKAINEWIHEQADEAEGREVLSTLGSLDRGEAWVWAPERGLLRRVGIRARETFDSSATPKRGERRAEPKVLAPVDLAKLTEETRATVERAKADDPKELRRQVADLKAKLAKVETAKPAAPVAKPKRVEVPVLKDKQIRRLELQAGRLEALIERNEIARNECADLGAVLTAGVREIRAVLATAQATAKGGSHEEPQGVAPRAGAGRNWKAGPAPAAPRPVAAPRPPRANAAPAGDLGKGERQVLAAIAQYGSQGASREQLTILTGYKRSSRDTFLGRLRAAGLIDQGGAEFVATPDGVAILGPDYELLPVGDALRDFWRGRLGGGELAVFDVVCEAYPKAITRDEVDARTEYKRSSRDTFIGRLTARKVITADRLGIRAADELFG